jgi:hypothetical protein
MEQLEQSTLPRMHFGFRFWCVVIIAEHMEHAVNQ